MKLSIKQNEALILLKEEKSLAFNSSKINGATVNSLYFKGLIKMPLYANGYFLELTDKGYEYIKNI